MKLSHFFLPHPETYKKAHLLSFQALAVYVIFFLLLYIGIQSVNLYKPGVLGVESAVNQQELIRLTNVEREKNGLAPVSEDSRLNAAAMEKAKNMFAENYWAHFSPSGKDPWGFINGAGYQFSYAGENLAKSFYKSDEVVSAWMASKTHRENILNNHYQNIGIAVLEGTLNGEKTTLVVQEFGRPVDVAIAQNPKSSPAVQSIQTIQSLNTPAPSLSANSNLAQASPAVQAQALVAGQVFSLENAMHDPYLAIKLAGMTLLFGLFILLAVDLYIIRKKAIYRVTSRHLPHLALISVAASVLFNLNPGQIM